MTAPTECNSLIEQNELAFSAPTFVLAYCNPLP